MGIGSRQLDVDCKMLDIGQQITALLAGRLDSHATADILFIGTQTNLLAYDVENNQDLFYKEVNTSGLN